VAGGTLFGAHGVLSRRRNAKDCGACPSRARLIGMENAQHINQFKAGLNWHLPNFW
jgi:hypothetical protein